MRIVFVSCFSAQLFQDKSVWQVWDEIGAANPDVLVLLGDSMYLDVGHESFGMQGIKKMQTAAFAAHAHKRYAGLVADPKFGKVVSRQGLKTYAIWDDHDFLWNNACGADVEKNPAYLPLVHASRAQFAAFRAALAAGLAPGSFPSAPAPWNPVPPPPGYSCVPLSHNTWLHLTDGRSFKKRGGKDAVVGMAQLDAMEARMLAAPAGAVHLVASGVVFEARNGETWLDCRKEYERMLRLAELHDVLFISGDIHDNNLAAYQLANERFMFEATSSGAALRTGVIIGSLVRNYGVLDIDDAQVSVEIFKSGALQYPAKLDRGSWRSI